MCVLNDRSRSVVFFNLNWLMVLFSYLDFGVSSEFYGCELCNLGWECVRNLRACVKFWDVNSEKCAWILQRTDRTTKRGVNSFRDISVGICVNMGVNSGKRCEFLQSGDYICQRQHSVSVSSEKRCKFLNSKQWCGCGVNF